MAATSGSLPLSLLLLLLLSGLFACSLAQSGHRDLLMLDRFHGWMTRRGRSYPTAAEKLRRFEVYRRNVEYIEATNQDGGLSYELGENEFTDLTDEEFLARYTGGLALKEDGGDMVITTRAGDVSEGSGMAHDEDNMAAVEGIPRSVNWTKKGAVTPAKNQNKCNACWAFAAVATVESLHQITTGELLTLSEQELLDCDRQLQSGCKSGSPYRALQWIHGHGGITTEEDYPYQAAKGDYCDGNKTEHHAATIGRYRFVSPNREDLLAAAVAKQPVAVAMDGLGDNMRHYKSGVYTGPCGTRMNHAVTLVGYGEDEEGVKYWIAKNSWGQTWGDQGFFIMRRGADGSAGLCGIAGSSAYPTM